MRCFWERGPLFVRELVAMAPEPKPHSIRFRPWCAPGGQRLRGTHGLREHLPVLPARERGGISRSTLGNVISRYFENSYLGAVSALVEEEKISVDELRELIERIETQNRG